MNYETGEVNHTKLDLYFLSYQYFNLKAKFATVIIEIEEKRNYSPLPKSS